MGSHRSGKSSIQRVVFHKMSPHETLFLEATAALDIKYIANNPFVQFQIWDFPGDYDFSDDIVYGGQTLNEEAVFRSCGALVFVIDAQDEPYTDALEKFHATVARAYRVNPDIHVEVFIHKVDGDLFLSDEQKTECQADIEDQINKELAEAEIDVHVNYSLTSIYDHSIFEAFSKVVQKLLKQLPTLENLLNILISSCGIEKAFLFDVVSKIYVATDSGPVDVHSFELCSDMIDVVIDVSCIYGMTDGEEGYAYDSGSASEIRLTGGVYDGMVLYLREVGNYLALVCLLREESFEKKGLIDYNIDSFRKALSEVFAAKGDRRGAAGGAGGDGDAGRRDA